MSIISKDVEGANPNPDIPPSPTLTRYQQLADEFTKSLDALVTALPSLEVSHQTTAPFVRTHQNTPDAFIETVISAVEQSPELKGVGTLDPTAARDTLQFIEAFRPLADKINAFGATLRFTVGSRRANLVARSQQMYGIAKNVARLSGGALVGQHVRNMKRDLGKRGRPFTKTPAAKQEGSTQESPGQEAAA